MCSESEISSRVDSCSTKFYLHDTYCRLMNVCILWLWLISNMWYTFNYDCEMYSSVWWRPDDLLFDYVLTKCVGNFFIWTRIPSFMKLLQWSCHFIFSYISLILYWQFIQFFGTRAFLNISWGKNEIKWRTDGINLSSIVLFFCVLLCCFVTFVLFNFVDNLFFAR